MAFFIGIACPWILVAWFLLVNLRRSGDPSFGQWRSEPSMFFGGPGTEGATSSATASVAPPAVQSRPETAAATAH